MRRRRTTEVPLLVGEKPIQISGLAMAMYLLRYTPHLIPQLQGELQSRRRYLRRDVRERRRWQVGDGEEAIGRFGRWRAWLMGLVPVRAHSDLDSQRHP